MLVAGVLGCSRETLTMIRTFLTIFLFIAWLAETSAQETGPIITDGIVKAPIESVWRAWSTSEGLRAWLAPHAEIDFRLGGLMRSNYNAEGSLSDPQTIENVILSFEPERMLSIKVSKAPAQFPFPNAIYKMWTVMYFEEVNENETYIRVVGMGFDPSEESQRMRNFFAQGNRVTIEQLQHYFSQAVRN